MAGGQRPFAVILGCSDSRVSPEIVFDQGLGDLFVARVAGNIADASVVETITYAVKHLGARLIVVLGHDACGAVTAAVANSDELPELMRELKPAVEQSGPTSDPASVARLDEIRASMNQKRGDTTAAG